uniref:Uncharacterized protein n=1 Tax=Arundo donax TaxID=35708 RepID=A0A0A9FZ93_ARUDO
MGPGVPNLQCTCIAISCRVQLPTINIHTTKVVQRLTLPKPV